MRLGPASSGRDQNGFGNERFTMTSESNVPEGSRRGATTRFPAADALP